MKLQNKVVIITGGAGGIGAGMGRAMAKEGAIIVAVDVNPETGAKTADELQQISPKSMFVQADLTDHANLKNIVEDVVTKYGHLDVLVNNAHASKQVPFLETTPENLALSMDTGFYPTWYLMQAAIPHLKETKGNIINFASGARLFGNKGQCSYAGAKEGIRGLTRVAATEWAADGINVNVVCPLAWTAQLEKFEKTYPEAFKANVHTPPMGHFGDNEKEIGRVVVQLTSLDFKYMTGETITLEGGLGMRP